MHLRARVRVGAGVFVVVAAALAAGLTGTSSAVGSVGAPTARAADAAPPGGYILDFAKYAGAAKHGPANPKLAPVKIGWSSVNDGGTVQSIGPEATKAAETAVKWLNKYADGIGGHPIELDECIVLNAEEEGLTCAQKFLNDKAVNVIAYGALTTGGTTIDNTVAGKKPIIAEFMLNASDLATKNLYALFGGANFAQYPIGGFAKEYLHAKTASLVYPNEASLQLQVTSSKLALKEAGITSTLVDFDPTSSDLVGAFTAAKVQSAGAVYVFATTPANCLSSAKALTQLKVNPNIVSWQPQCNQPTIRTQYPGGDYPHYWQSIAQSGDAFAGNPTGLQFKKNLAAFGQGVNYTDDWYSAVWGQIFTIAQFMNKVGYKNLSTSSIINQVKQFRGPLLLGGPDIQCGRYKFAPGSCSDGNYFFHYVGHDKYVRSRWIEEPPALKKRLEALKPGASFPTS